MDRLSSQELYDEYMRISYQYVDMFIDIAEYIQHHHSRDFKTYVTELLSKCSNKSDDNILYSVLSHLYNAIADDSLSTLKSRTDDDTN